MSYYEAKFARERKERPSHWVILGSGDNCRLVYLGPCAI